VIIAYVIKDEDALLQTGDGHSPPPRTFPLSILQTFYRRISRIHRLLSEIKV